jgi:putative transcriptional regulator
MADPRYFTGQFLLAMPGIGDPRFDKSIIAVCSHDEGGALGIGIGRLASLSLHELFAQFDLEIKGIPDAPIYTGGPVEPRRGFVLHSLDWGGQGTIDVAGKWALSSSVDVLRVIGRPEGPSKWLVALGYAGWSAGQLDEEMTRHGWHLAPGDAALLFDHDTDDKWRAGFLSTGIDPKMLTLQSGRA